MQRSTKLSVAYELLRLLPKAKARSLRMFATATPNDECRGEQVMGRFAYERKHALSFNPSDPAIAELPRALQNEEPTEPDYNVSFSTISELAESYETGRVTPIEVLQLSRRRLGEIESVQPRTKIMAYSTTHADNTLTQIDTIDGVCGATFTATVPVPEPVRAVPFIDEARNADPSEQEVLPAKHHNTFSTLIARKALFLGFSVMSANSYGLHSNSSQGKSRNPFSWEKTTAGSSGGSAAAVATGVCTFALGSDGGGSVRMPASACGLLGIVPDARLEEFQVGRVRLNTARTGVLARSVRDAAIVLDAAMPSSAGFASTLSIAPSANGKKLRVGWCVPAGTDQEIAAVFRRWIACRTAAANSVFVFDGKELEWLDASAQRAAREYWGADYQFRWRASSEAEKAHRLVHDAADCDALNLPPGAGVTAREVMASAIVPTINRLFADDSGSDGCDVVISPTLTVLPWNIEESYPPGFGPNDKGGAAFQTAYPYNFTGHASAPLPIGMAAGMPVGACVAVKFVGSPPVLIAPTRPNAKQVAIVTAAGGEPAIDRDGGLKSTTLLLQVLSRLALPPQYWPRPVLPFACYGTGPIIVNHNLN